MKKWLQSYCGYCCCSFCESCCVLSFTVVAAVAVIAVAAVVAATVVVATVAEHPLRMSSLTRLSQDRWEIFSINRLRRVLGNKTIGLNSFDEQQTNNFWVNYTIFTFLPTTCYRGSLAHKLEASVILDPSLNYRHPKTRDYITWFILRGSTSLFVFGWQDETDVQMYNTNSLYSLIGRWIWLPNLLLASKWIQLLDPFLVSPCM